ncbi:hypothetical protein [Lentilitoribacter sp. Alg239-R112]|uniref:hypothetical protein n=1 Tax=Lentilitoribacter sp. Alg239-R112 TaxID=2305987 RepID=UPI0013A68A4E|nr:hypothetical protein [Lentilitoribacter sp. Alg239-R112]
MSWRDDFKQNQTLSIALHMIIWAVLSGVGIVVIIVMKLFTWPFIITAMVGTFMISFPISWAIVRGMMGNSSGKNH